jgi:hypothetical protein
MGIFVIPRAQTLRFVRVFGNLEKFQIFTRNNCGEGSEGTAVTYTVPANTYFSYLSQVDADQLAIDDITLNGQTYANQHGSCIFMNYIFEYVFVSLDDIQYFGSTGSIPSIEDSQLRINLGIGGNPNYLYVLPKPGGINYYLSPGNYRSIINIISKTGDNPSVALRYGVGSKTLSLGENIVDFTVSSTSLIFLQFTDDISSTGASFLIDVWNLQSL